MTESAIQSLANFTGRRFDQLMRYEDGRTPLYLTEEQYNAIRDLVAHASAQPAAPQCDHQWTDDGEHLLICTECGAQEDHDPKWRDMATAPRDGTMLRLLVEFTDHATEDADQAPTIGANNFDNGGEDHWQFAGWCWTHDHFTEGKGEPIGWLPMLEDPRRTPAAQPADGVKSDE